MGQTSAERICRLNPEKKTEKKTVVERYQRKDERWRTYQISRLTDINELLLGGIAAVGDFESVPKDNSYEISKTREQDQTGKCNLPIVEVVSIGRDWMMKEVNTTTIYLATSVHLLPRPISSKFTTVNGHAKAIA